MKRLAIGFFSVAVVLWTAAIISMTWSLITTGDLLLLMPIGIVVYLIHDNITYIIKELRNT